MTALLIVGGALAYLAGGILTGRHLYHHFGPHGFQEEEAHAFIAAAAALVWPIVLAVLGFVWCIRAEREK